MNFINVQKIVYSLSVLVLGGPLQVDVSATISSNSDNGNASTVFQVSQGGARRGRCVVSVAYHW